MARKSDAALLIRAVSLLPWWVAVLLALFLYLLFANILPAILLDHGFLSVLGPIMRIVALALVGLCAIGMAVGFITRRRQRRLYEEQQSLETIRSLHWRDFEHLMTEVLRRQGYACRVNEGGPDGGVDIRLERSGKRYLVQCKQWREGKVGVRPVRELAGVVAAEGAQGGMFVCTGTYTAEARKFADGAGVELIDGSSLARMLDVQSKAADDSADRAEEAEPTRIPENEVCPRCGGVLVRRVARRGKRAGSGFLGCSHFPSCRYTRDLQ